MILAAGFGTRMRPLTEKCPKPLLKAGGTPLIEHTIAALQGAGISDLVINHAWLGHLIESALGDGSRFGARIRYSSEGTPLETAGGIKKALPLLNAREKPLETPFIVVNADIWTDYDFSRLASLNLPDNTLAHLVMVNNPDHNPEGDFAAIENQPNQIMQLFAKSAKNPRQTLTYSGIGLYRPSLFKDLPAGPYPLAPILTKAMQRAQISGEKHRGQWSDIGTPEKLAWLDRHLNGY